MEALVHGKPHCPKTFSHHCTKGYVIGTSYEHYCGWKVWTPSLHTTCISSTVFFKHKYITNPSVTPADAIIVAAVNLSHLLTNSHKAHHNNNLQQTDLTGLQILTQLPPLPPQREQHKPNTRNAPSSQHPSTPPVVSDYDSDSSASDDESVAAPLLQAATRCFPGDALSVILDTDTGELLEYRLLFENPKYCTTWKNAYGKELGRLAQGIPGTVQGTNTIVFITPNQIPPNCQRDVTYGRICATIDLRRMTHITSILQSAATESLTLVLLNSVISTKGARFMTIDIRYFHLNTPMVRSKYMRLKVSDIPDNIIALYKLNKLTTTDG
eukprot:CCRYP_007095-RA/>CCRYP_007095-RA protein AED:0.38 eAED:0.31 QI:0/0/0/1/0/0/3/0/325